MNFTQAVASGFRRYFDFRTRSSRSEYWWWTLFSLLAPLAGTALDALLFGESAVLETISSLALLIPGIALGMRRAHDMNQPGWWFLVVFAIWIASLLLYYFRFESGVLILLVLAEMLLIIFWFVRPGTRGPNRYGPDPLRSTPSPELGADLDGTSGEFNAPGGDGFCANCGTALEPNANFCRSCGIEV